MKTYAIFDNSFFTTKPWWMPHKLHTAVCHRSNPRSREYMLDLLQEKFPDAKLINTDSLHQAGQLILLYPDSIGLGGRKLEKRLMAKFNEIKILNGRNRCFSLNKGERINLLIKRFLEISFLPEIIFAPFLLLVGITLAVKDKLIDRS